MSELGLAYLNLGDKKKSLSYYDMVVKTAPQSSDAKDALQGIRDIYVSEGDAGGYFDYARKSGVEGDLTAMSRDSLSFAAARSIFRASLRRRPSRYAVTSKVIPRDIIRLMRSIA